MGARIETGPVSVGTALTGFLLGFGAAFGWALGSGLISLVGTALLHGAH